MTVTENSSVVTIQFNKTSTPSGTFIVTPSLEGQTKGKKAASLQEVRLTLSDTNPVFSCLRESYLGVSTDLLRALGILPHTTARRSTVHLEGLKQ